MASTLGVTDDHVALHDTVRRWASTHCPPSVPRAFLDTDDEPLPAIWDDLASHGWLGIHLPAEHGGEGYGLLELAVVLEELGRVCAPGPFLATVLASAVVDRLGDEASRAAVLPGLASGRARATLAFGGVPGVLRDGAITGDWPVVLSAAQADLVVLPATDGDDPVWCVVDRNDLEVSVRRSVDPTRRVASVRADTVPVAHERVLRGDHQAVTDLATILLAAEAVGGAAWCVDTASSYAQVREQFGRPIGQFQAVKHRCADMLCTLELARAAAWDAVRSTADGDELALLAAMTGGLAPAAFLSCAKDVVQVLGGIGFTWEHDAHLYLKRAMAISALVGDTHAFRARTVSFARGGVRRELTIELPPEAEVVRSGVQAELAEVKEHPKEEWRSRLGDAGFLAPHWPRPWGRDADPVEQLVIEEEMARARVGRHHLQVGAWALPTLITHGMDEQQQRLVPPTLRGEVSWCQLFSEPGAGSDLASLSTKASRTDGGWLLSGQKVWTSMAADADYGICLARTDPTVPKHEGITCFVVDMRAEGIDIRPLRELTGAAMFNEVFLSDVFVSDDDVVGSVNGGWAAARTTLANERVSMSSGSSFGFRTESLVELLGEEPDPLAVDAVGELLVESHAHAVLGLRMAARALSGAEPGPESSVRKLIGVEHEQRVQDVGLQLLGAAAAVDEGEAARWVAGFLSNRCLTIAGGTSEVQRNVIAERLLGLPKDP